MKLRHALLAAVLPATALFAAPAQAATYLVTYTGDVLNGIDRAGHFGTVGAFTGPFTAAYTLTVPSVQGPGMRDDGSEGYANGGEALGRPSPMSAVLTINGISKVIDGLQMSWVYQRDNVYDDIVDRVADRVSHIAMQWLDGDSAYQSSIQISLTSTTDMLATSDFTQPLDYTVRPGDRQAGLFTYVDQLGRSSGSLRADRITIAQLDAPGAVPEPATWAMMLVGFGAVGAVMRRTRVRAKVRYDFA